jgi:alginate O-acetyltransferase complex protein AlgI
MSVHRFWVERRAQRRRALRKLKKTMPEPGPLEILASHALTLVSLMFVNVMFRATTVAQGVMIWRGMAGWDQLSTTEAQHAVFGSGLAALLTISIAIIFLMPNTQQIMRRFQPALNWGEWKDEAKPAISWTWTPSPQGLGFAAAALFLGILFVERGQQVFIYFNF